MPALVILIPLAMVLVLNLPFQRILCGLAFWAGVLFCAAQALFVVLAPACFWNSPLPLVNRLLRFVPGADSLSLVMFLSIAIVGMTSLMVARHNIRDCGKLFNFSNLAILAVAGMNGVVAANDLFSLYVFLEVTAVASYILIAFNRDRDAF